MANTAHLPKYDEKGRRLQSFKHGDVEPIRADDTSNQLIGMLVRTLKKARPPIYEPDEEGFNRFKAATIAYLEEVKAYNEDPSHEQKLLLDIESWVTSIGMSRMTLSKYYNERGQIWKDFIDLVKSGIVAVKKDYAARGKMPPVLFIFDSINNFHYMNVTDIHVTAEPAGGIKPK